MATIGKNIKRIRKEKHLTQSQLGEKCIPQMADSAIRRYESDRITPKISTVRKIAKALEVPLSDLIQDWDQFSFEELRKDFFDPVVKEADLILEQCDALKKVRTVFDKDAEHILTVYSVLNEDGKIEAVKRISELAEITRYAISED